MRLWRRCCLRSSDGKDPIAPRCAWGWCDVIPGIAGDGKEPRTRWSGERGDRLERQWSMKLRRPCCLRSSDGKDPIAPRCEWGWCDVIPGIAGDGKEPRTRWSGDRGDRMERLWSMKLRRRCCLRSSDGKDPIAPTYAWGWCDAIVDRRIASAGLGPRRRWVTHHRSFGWGSRPSSTVSSPPSSGPQLTREDHHWWICGEISSGSSNVPMGAET